MRRNVLLIEHDRDLAEQLGQEMRNAGFAVMALQDADEAVDLLRLATFDVILADVGTLCYSTAHNSGLAAVMQVVHNAPLLRFTTLATMGRGSPGGAILLEDLALDWPRLLDAIAALFHEPAAPIAV